MRRLQIKFPSQIRISGWDFGSSARAMNQAGGKDALMTYLRVIFTQAESGKCPGSTFERKTMSSTIKRIALVAVAALSLGGVTAITASATPVTAEATPCYASTSAYTSVSGSDTATASITVSQVAGAANYIEITCGTDAAASSQAVVTVSGAGATILATGNGSTGSWSTNTAGSQSVYSNNDISGGTIKVGTPTAGTATVTVAKRTFSNGAATDTTLQTFTVTVTAAGVAGVADAASSTSLLDAEGTTSGTTAPTADESVVVAKAAGTAAGVATLTIKDANGVVVPNPSSANVSATVSGPGNVALNSTLASATYATSGKVVTGSTSSGVIYAAFYADGQSGKSTITFKVGSTVIATETVTFYGSLASLTATVKKNIANSGSATTGAIEVIGKDAEGNVVPSQGLTITSSATSVVADYTATSSSVSEATAGTASVSVTGISSKYGSVVLTIADTATKLVSTTATVVVGATEAAAVTVTLDDSTYAPGALVTATISAKDANGVAVADAASVSSAYAITSNVAVQGTMPTAAAFVKGVQTFTFYAPATSGDFKLSVKLAASSAWSTALDDTTISVSAVVTGSADAALDAANEATDAANAATDAANAAAEAADAATAAAQDAQAAVAALATQVASLIAGIKAQITTLTNLVIKIQKKVKA